MKMILGMLLLAALSGCAAAPVYQKSSASLPLEERQKAYERYSTTYSFWEGFKVGGVEYGKPEKALIASGDPQTVALAEDYRAAKWTGMAIGIVGTLVGSYAMAARHNGENRWESVDAQFVGTMLGVAVAQAVVVKWGKERYLAPAGEAYNKYLEQDLGLAKGGDHGK